MISVDSEGKITKINYNNATRDSVLDLPLHQVQPFYRALKAYVDIMNRPENVVTYTMEPGQWVTLKTLTFEKFKLALSGHLVEVQKYSYLFSFVTLQTQTLI